MIPVGDLEIDWFETMQGQMGSAHSVSGDAPPPDPVEQLRAVVEEVTRRPLPERKRRIGFI